MTKLRNIWEKNWPEVHAAVTGGLPGFVLARRPCELGASVPVFCYHVVEAEGFKTDLDFLSQNGYVTIDADALLSHMEGNTSAPERAIVLTFDDGARNLYEVVFPLLERYRMKAVAFVAPGLHEEETSDSSHGLGGGSPLSWSQIKEMHESGVIDFQSHTHQHRFVPRWPEAALLIGSDPDVVNSRQGAALTIEEDFRASKETLEQKLNKAVNHLAFAKYFGSPEAVRVGRELGYKGFWWGVLPRRPGNRPGQSPSYLVRVDGQFLRRLPGDDRESLAKILLARYRGGVLRLRNGLLKMAR